MTLWKITTLEEGDYDEYDSFVVRAPNETEARELAAVVGSQNYDRWRDPTRSSCVELDQNGRAEVIIGSFNAG